jgi:hypothetical protein
METTETKAVEQKKAAPAAAAVKAKAKAKAAPKATAKAAPLKKELTAAEGAEVLREVKAAREKAADKDGKLPKGAIRKIYTAVAEAHGTKRRVVRRLVNVAARAAAAKKK